MVRTKYTFPRHVLATFQFLLPRISCVPLFTLSTFLLTVLYLAWLTVVDFVLQLYLPPEWLSQRRCNFPFPSISWRGSFCSINPPPPFWSNAITRECTTEGHDRFTLCFFSFATALVINITTIHFLLTQTMSMLGSNLSIYLTIRERDIYLCLMLYLAQ